MTVSLVKYDAWNSKKRFLVIDLSGGSDAERWPVSYLDAVPEGGWTDEYKTTKLVLRRIERGTIEGINSPLGLSITIDKPYYVGVFEVTSAQHEQMTGGKGGDGHPVRGVSYDELRGAERGALYPSLTTVDETSVIGILRAKTGLATLDLPTEKQWEYACRAGTTSAYNNGGSTEEDLKTLGRYASNVNDGRGDFGGVTTVGSYAPNRWGLYDMHGNVSEWCLDRYNQEWTARVARGGSYRDYDIHCRSGYRGNLYKSSGYDYNGFRLSCSAGQ